jgi:hypothetical protein
MNEDTILMLLGAAALAWWYFSSSSTTTTSAPASTATGTTPVVLSTGSQTTVTTPVAVTPTPVTTNPPITAAPYANTLAKLQSAISTAGVDITSLQTPDVWNYYLMSVVPGWTAPAPEQEFPSLVTATTNNAHQATSFQTWWAAVMPFLPSGLTGLGNLGFRASGMFPYGGWGSGSGRWVA